MTASPLLTDFYELTMAQGYFLEGREDPAVFDMFIRKNPFGGGYTVFAGLTDLLKILEDYRFGEDDLAFLESLPVFRKEFIDYLSAFRFTGDIHAPDEGTLFFPNEPVLRVHAPLPEAQIAESLILSIINSQSLTATKTSRFLYAAGEDPLLEFGLRRSGGPENSVAISRAAFIAGASATSNTLAGKLYNIPVKGTMAHSWIMAFPSEKEAFEKYSEIYPYDSILLLDTYDTLGSGLRNAVKTARNLEKKGIDRFGVRIDSGDILTLSRSIRETLDREGLKKAVIVASGDLDEFRIDELKRNGAPVDIWGIGTKLASGYPDGALTGVYKLAALRNGGRWRTVYKTTDDENKSSLPGIKEIIRRTENGHFTGDTVLLQNEKKIPEEGETENILKLKMKDGKTLSEDNSLYRLREKFLSDFEKLPDQYKKLENPDNYPVQLSENLKNRIKKDRPRPVL